MLTVARPRSTAADLMRLLAVWLAVILLAQGFAAAFARAQGPWHRHHATPAGAATAHSHAWGERHHHEASDSSVQSNPAADAADDEARLALAAALTLLALGLRAAPKAPNGRHVLRPVTTWVRATAPHSRPFKPPRRG